MRKIGLLLTAVCLLNVAKAQVKTELVDYKGWKKAVQLSNNEIKVVVVPQIGRIMYFSYLDENNLLYENTALEGQAFNIQQPFRINGIRSHAGFGGDRIWPTNQDDFKKHNGKRSLPDPWIDGEKWNYELVKNGVKITSRTSNYLGVQVSRTITLNKKGSTVNIEQSMKKIKLGKQRKNEPIAVTIWSLSKVENPEFGLLPLSENSTFENSIDFQNWPDNTNSAPKNYTQHGTVGQLVPKPMLFQKMGTDSRGWVAGVYDDKVFGQFFTFDKRETYPDGGTSATIFTCTEFTELECLSPEKTLKIGESIEFNIQWKLNKLSSKTIDKRREQATEWLEEQLENK